MDQHSNENLRGPDKNMNSNILQRSELLDALWNFQNTHGYIRDEDVQACSDALGVSKIDVEGVISFYHFFHRKPCGEFTVYLNNSIVSNCMGFARVKACDKLFVLHRQWHDLCSDSCSMTRAPS